MKWSRVQLVLSIVTAAGLWQTLRERVGFAPAPGDGSSHDDSAHAAALPTHYDLAGALHIHSRFSDGTGTVAEIADAAARAGLDFIVLTDHSSLAAKTNGEDGWQSGGRVLILVGTEIATDAGHLLIFGVPEDFDVQPHSAAELMRAAVESDGYGYIALPCDLKDHWTDFKVRNDRFGIEVFNLSAIARTKINLPGFLLTLSRYVGKRPISAFSYVAGRPVRELQLWDRLCREAFDSGAPIPKAIGSLDAHAVMRFGGREYPYPTYEEVFRTLRTHVIVSALLTRDQRCAQRDVRAIDHAIAAGHSYISFDNYGDARGFSFQVRTEKECVAIVGDRYVSEPRWPEFIDVRSPSHRSIIRLLCDGKVVAKARGRGLRYPVRRPGVYRVEVDNYRARIGGLCLGTHPWIFSNPIDIHDARS